MVAIYGCNGERHFRSVYFRWGYNTIHSVASKYIKSLCILQVISLKSVDSVGRLPKDIKEFAVAVNFFDGSSRLFACESGQYKFPFTTCVYHYCFPSYVTTDTRKFLALIWSTPFLIIAVAVTMG